MEGLSDDYQDNGDNKISKYRYLNNKYKKNINVIKYFIFQQNT